MVDKVDNAPAGAPPEAVAARAPETVGQTLLKARTALGLSLEQCATDLRIEQAQLAALEGDKFERIGVPVFVKGYLRQYGQRLGLDARELLATYYRQGNLQEIEIKPSRTIRLREDRHLGGWVVAILVVLALAALFSVWWFGDFQINTFIAPPVVAPPAAQPRAELQQPPAPAAAVAPAPAAEPVALPAAEPHEAAPLAAPAEPPPATSAPPVARGAEAPARGNAVEVAAVVRPDPISTPRAQPAAREPATDAATAERPAAVASYATDVELAFDQESFAEVVDARGERLFTGNGAKGRRVLLHGEPPFSVVLGNADGVRVQFDGGPYPIPAEGRDGKRARFSLDISED